MIKSFYLTKRVYFIASLAAVIYLFSYFLPFLFPVGHLVLTLLLIAVFADSLLIYSLKSGITGSRTVPDRLSNGDSNKVCLQLFNHYSFPVTVDIIDELPEQLQERSWLMKTKIEKGGSVTPEYFIRPTERGEYVFGNINVYVNGLLFLARKRYTIDAEKLVKVYPSFIELRRYQLLAASNRLQEAGVKPIRRLGHSMEFEQIREYVRGDDYRTVNWKATARKQDLMVNSYTDERSQQIYCIINKGRVMKMPFEGLSLLDYAINASLMLSNVALLKQDKAGLITFAENTGNFLPADKKPTQMNLLQEILYKEQTRFLEADFEKLYAVVRGRITHRSLLVLFTNFESLESLQREMPSLARMAKYHLLLVVFFENTELQLVLEKNAVTIEDIYIKTIAEKFMFEKRLMVKELHKNGIPSILTRPENLTVNTINKYLELKNRMSI